MNDENVDLVRRYCPYVVVEVIRLVEKMKDGDRLVCCVDDPLATKSIPEELEEFENVRYFISKKKVFWEVIIEKGSSSRPEHGGLNGEHS